MTEPMTLQEMIDYRKRLIQFSKSRQAEDRYYTSDWRKKLGQEIFLVGDKIIDSIEKSLPTVNQ